MEIPASGLPGFQRLSVKPCTLDGGRCLWFLLVLSWSAEAKLFLGINEVNTLLIYLFSFKEDLNRQGPVKIIRKQICTCHMMGVIEGVGSDVFSGSTPSANEAFLYWKATVTLSLKNKMVYLNRSRHNIGKTDTKRLTLLWADFLRDVIFNLILFYCWFGDSILRVICWSGFLPDKVKWCIFPHT